MLTNSPHIYNKKNKKRIRLTVKDRAWYAVATRTVVIRWSWTRFSTGSSPSNG